MMWYSDNSCASYETAESLNTRFAGTGCHVDGGMTVTKGLHFNGSGPQAFGGAESWPVVKVLVSLPADRPYLAALLASRLQDVLFQFAQEEGLLK